MILFQNEIKAFQGLVNTSFAVQQNLLCNKSLMFNKKQADGPGQSGQGRVHIEQFCISVQTLVASFALRDDS